MKNLSTTTNNLAYPSIFGPLLPAEHDATVDVLKSERVISHMNVQLGGLKQQPELYKYIN